jgi:hypothetical protein
MLVYTPCLHPLMIVWLLPCARLAVLRQHIVRLADKAPGSQHLPEAEEQLVRAPCASSAMPHQPAVRCPIQQGAPPLVILQCVLP